MQRLYNMTSFDSARFRSACGTYPTGVAIVTTRSAAGRPVGLTINSFSSLSLDPPLILWNVATSSTSHDAFATAEHFAVHVLHAGQEELSRRFASRDPDRFAGIALDEGIGGIPVLADFQARLQCTRQTRLDGGDHSILIGQVAHIDLLDYEPLIFFRGRYRALGNS